MQCQPIRCAHIPYNNDDRSEKEVIHSGHFMVSDFEAEEQDDEYEVAVPVPESKNQEDLVPPDYGLQVFNVNKAYKAMQPGQLAIETSLAKLFQCMSLAYRQKLTSPKWNRFKGIRLRWKDKIRLNNVIWRCWHMQFIKRENTLICQFASPLDEGIHNKPEAVVLEGKYWKRKLAAVTAEYKKWRMFYRNKIMGWAGKDYSFVDSDILDWQSQNNDGAGYQQMMVDEDYMDLMSDTLFSTISSNQPFAFPDIREIDSCASSHNLNFLVNSASGMSSLKKARGASLADFIQPSLVQLQPNLDDFMDTFEPLQEFYSSKLPPVPEHCAVADATYRPTSGMDAAPAQQARHPSPTAIANAQPPSFSYQEQKNPQFYARDPEPAESASQPTKYSYNDTQNIKTSRVYLTKQENQFMSVPSQSDLIKTEVTPVETFAYSDACDTHNFVTVPVPSTSQRTYKAVAPPPATAPPNYGYHRGIAATPTSQQYSRVHQSYDLACSVPEPHPANLQGSVVRSSSLPSVAKEEIFAVPKVQLKSRHRSRSGSSLLSNKSRQHPPPLLSSNSDPNLNAHKSALLTQLLTTASPGIYNVTNVSSSHKPGSVPILPMPTSTARNSAQQTNTLLITTTSLLPATQGYLSNARLAPGPESPPDGSSSHSLTSPPLGSPLCQDSQSPKRMEQPERNKTPPQGTDQRRACHINAEQKRRYNIRNGFEMLHSLIPQLQINPNVKLSKAAMLQKGAEYIKQLQAERMQAKDEIENLRHQIECLNSAISNCQAMLPATGAPVSRHRTTKLREMFDDWVRQRTLDNWRFWIFSVLFEPLVTTFNGSVSTASYEDLYRSTLMWVEQHCSLVNLRPAVLNSLRSLSTSTDILTDPQKLPDEARAAVGKRKTQNAS